MKMRVFVTVLAVLGLVAGVAAQDPLLGKGKGGGSQSSGSKASSGSRKATTSRTSRDPISYGTPGRFPDAQDTLLQRGRQSRSGQVRYGTVYNSAQRGVIRDPIRIDSAPTLDDLRRRTLNREIQREDHIRIEGQIGGLRVGYYHWNRNWRDDNFWYPYYHFTPYQPYGGSVHCVVSPWYYYAQLPPYIDYGRVYWVTPPPAFLGGTPVDWRARRMLYDRRDLNELDFAIEDLRTAFLDGDRRALNRLIPRSGNVVISVDNTTIYAIRTDDFYDMMSDLVENSRTLDYDIVEVRTKGYEAEIVARHEYRDSWGHVASVYHRYRVVEERGRAAIRYFATSGSRVG